MVAKKAPTKKTTKPKAKPVSRPAVVKKPTGLQAVTAGYTSVTKTMKKMPIIGRLLAEFIGAFILTASFIQMQGNPLFFGFALVGVILFVGTVSGANPAMTVAGWVTRKINFATALGYIAAQLIGASVAFLVLNTFMKASTADAQAALGAASPALFQAAELVKGKEWYLFFAELLGTTVLALGIAQAIRQTKIVSAFAGGLAVLVALYITLSLTTNLVPLQSGVTLSFLNPAVAFAANALKWEVWPLVVYVLAPVLGAVAGFAIHEFLRDAIVEEA